MNYNTTCFLNKRINVLILIFVLATCISCQNRDFQDIESNIDTINLTFCSSQSKVQTRSTQSSFYENRIENLYLFIFDATSGEKIRSTYYEDYDLYATTDQERNKGVLKLKIPRGQEVIMYAIANIENDIAYLSMNQLDRISHRTELEQIEVSLRQEITARGSAFVMSGYVENNSTHSHIISSRSNTNNYTLRLKRIDAKIFFHITTVDGATFTPKYWQVKEAATKAKIVEGAQDRSHSSSSYFNHDREQFDSNGLGFSFYLLENIQAAKKQISYYDSNGYQKREEQEKHYTYNPQVPGQRYVNGEFKYAPIHGSYVELAGELSYKDPQTGLHTVADVTYTIHLGYANQDINDYSVNRNSEYHYYVRLKSAKAIEIEVTNGTELQPGATGHITSGGEIITTDAHYSTHQLTFRYDDIGYLTWYVKTPFNEGYREDLVNELNNGDNHWVLFKLNTRARSYYGGYYYTKGLETFPGIGKMHRHNEHVQNLLSNNGKLMTANQLINLLHYSKRESQEFYNAYGYHSNQYFDLNNEIVVTAYVNEFYYDKHPTTERQDKTLWKEFVNKPERVFTLLNQSQYSADGESSLIKSLVSIRQQSIQTIYNTNISDLQTAWGVESIQETGLLPFDQNEVYEDYRNRNRNPKYKSNSNGRLNTIEILKDRSVKYWSSIINQDSQILKANYNAIKYACMLRNRDENGNGKIDHDEVKWYLSAIDQLTDLWIGESSIDQRAKLYKRENGTANEWYISSTVHEEFQSGNGRWGRYLFWDNPWVIWAKEGSSTGLMNNLPNFNTPTKEYNYRCVRNLGLDSDKSAKEEPEDFVKVRNNTISLPYLNKQSIRKYSQKGELPLHHERDADNMPWWSFEVAPNVSLYQGRTINWPELSYLINSGKSPCPKGYRVPNQRELAIMKSRLPHDYQWKLENHLSRTRYSMNPDGGTRYGFSVQYKGEILYLINSSSDKGGVRCVRDNQGITF